MNDNFDKALQLVLKHEGGFVNHPRDPGGATNKGVTLQTFRRFFGPSKTVDDLRTITSEQLAHVYRSGYWDKCRCDQLPGGVDYAVFDVAVNSGPGRAVKFVQAAVGATQDGVIGPNTLELVAGQDAAVLINTVCDWRLVFLQGLSTFDTFGKGWTRRVAEVRSKALEMLEGTCTVDAAPEILLNMDYEIVRLHSEGPWVTRLQKALNITADGVLGPKTEAALIAFQLSNHLEPDGVAGRMTYRTLGLIA